MVNQVLRNLTVAGYLIRGEGRRMLITRALPEHHAP
jgi:hypothetical protein